MVARLFKQQGRGYQSSTPMSITAQIDGVTVYSGTVPTLNQPFPEPEAGVIFGEDLYTWSIPDMTWTGTQELAITVEGTGIFLLGDTLAQIYPGAASNYYGMIFDGSPDPAVGPYDPLSNVKINGVPQSSYPNPGLDGQWGWGILGGSNFTATITTNVPGIPPWPWNIDFNGYRKNDVVIDGTQCYQALADVPANTPITDTTYWVPVS